MKQYTVTFEPQDRQVQVPKGSTLLEAVTEAGITINNLCGGEGICGRCRMKIKQGEVSGGISEKLSREEIRQGYVLACMTRVEDDLAVEIPAETLASDKAEGDRDAARFKALIPPLYTRLGDPSPLVSKIYLEIDKPVLSNNTADHQRVCEAIIKRLGVPSMQMGLKIIRTVPGILRDNDFRITATVGLRRDISEVMQIEGGDTSERSFMIVVDIGTTTVVAHLVDANRAETLDGAACFNSQGVYGREVTGRMIQAEKIGHEKLQQVLIDDLNMLIEDLSRSNGVALKDITAVVCGGNTPMSHFLLGLSTQYIRRDPYVAASVEPPPVRAVEVGIEINPRGLLYSLPGISGWVGSDITAGILATGIHENEEISMLVDIGTNGEIVIGNRDWLVACSASAGPALEGASVECGMRAEAGAVERVYIDESGDIQLASIGHEKPKGICGSGIIDAVAVLLKKNMINRSGKIQEDGNDRVESAEGIKRYLFGFPDTSARKDGVFLTEADIENIITAKAAIYAAMRILLRRLDLSFTDIERLYIGGAFGSYIDVEHAVTIGLIPDIQRERIEFAGNTSIVGATMTAFYEEAFDQIRAIRQNTTYYDLMGANDYVEEFRRALFLPHTDIEQFPSVFIEQQ